MGGKGLLRVDCRGPPTIQQANKQRREPGQYQHIDAHADSQGVVGRDGAIAGAKIDPLAGAKQAATTAQGLDDESVDSSRIQPLGTVREEMK